MNDAIICVRVLGLQWIAKRFSNRAASSSTIAHRTRAEASLVIGRAAQLLEQREGWILTPGATRRRLRRIA
jgi:hypothetical protein